MERALCWCNICKNRCGYLSLHIKNHAFLIKNILQSSHAYIYNFKDMYHVTENMPHT